MWGEGVGATFETGKAGKYDGQGSPAERKG